MEVCWVPVKLLSAPSIENRNYH